MVPKVKPTMWGHFLPKSNSWEELSLEYYYLKSLLIEKYGNPSDVSEYFEGGEPAVGPLKVINIELGLCHYSSRFTIPGGTANLLIGYMNDSCLVFLYYHDGETWNHQSAINDI